MPEQQYLVPTATPSNGKFKLGVWWANKYGGQNQEEKELRLVHVIEYGPGEEIHSPVVTYPYETEMEVTRQAHHSLILVDGINVQRVAPTSAVIVPEVATEPPPPIEPPTLPPPPPPIEPPPVEPPTLPPTPPVEPPPPIEPPPVEPILEARIAAIEAKAEERTKLTVVALLDIQDSFDKMETNHAALAGRVTQMDVTVNRFKDIIQKINEATKGTQ